MPAALMHASTETDLSIGADFVVGPHRLCATCGRGGNRAGPAHNPLADLRPLRNLHSAPAELREGCCGQGRVRGNGCHKPMQRIRSDGIAC